MENFTLAKSMNQQKNLLEEESKYLRMEIKQKDISKMDYKQKEKIFIPMEILMKEIS